MDEFFRDQPRIRPRTINRYVSSFLGARLSEALPRAGTCHKLRNALKLD